MLDRQFFDELSQKITRLMPQATDIGEDVKASLNQLLQKSFAELNLLTRDEFEASERALQRAQERINTLEQTVHSLEKQLQNIESDG